MNEIVVRRDLIDVANFLFRVFVVMALITGILFMGLGIWTIITSL